MITHELTQGSPEWLAYRASHFNASDAPAMMGCSPYKTRTQLLHEMHTGLTPEVDAGTQRRFDDGHRFEALARPLAEAIIGDDLYPVTGSAGKLSASFDGLTMDERRNFEHKRLNNNLRTIMVDGCNGVDLDMMYQVQMEQQHMVAGADRTLFMASEWDGDELIESRHCWYETNLLLRAAIVAGWAQFEIDLAAYTPSAQVIEAVGHTPESLPALRIEVTGMVTASNLEAYKTHALAVFGGINRELKTDQQFADAEKVVKWCGDIEERLAAAKQHALSQTESIDALFRTIDDISTEARRTRLELDKLVKGRKEAVRGEIVAEGIAKLDEHARGLNARLAGSSGRSYMPHITADFAGAIKGKRTIDSLRDAVSTTLANAKIEASAIADKIQANLRHLSDVNAPMALFADLSSICLKAQDDFAMLVKSRVDGETARIEALAEMTREVIRKEEQAKLAAEAIAAAYVEATKALAAAPVIPPTVAAAPLITTALHTLPVTQAQFDRTYPVKTAPMTPPTLKLGQIGERLGFSLTGDFLKSLGFEPAARDKSALLFHEASFTLICAALVAHINGVQERRAA